MANKEVGVSVSVPGYRYAEFRSKEKEKELASKHATHKKAVSKLADKHGVGEAYHDSHETGVIMNYSTHPSKAAAFGDAVRKAGHGAVSYSYAHPKTGAAIDSSPRLPKTLQEHQQSHWGTGEGNPQGDTK